MKENIDQFLYEEKVDALWVMGAMMNNPDMVYFTGIHHVSQADLIKIRGRQPIVYHFSAMEHEEAAQSGLQTCVYDQDFPLPSYLKKCDNDLPSALAGRIKDVFTKIGLTHGRVAISGFENLAYAFSLLDKIKSSLPEINFLSFMNNSPIRQARMTKNAEEIERIRRMGNLTIEVVNRTAEYLTSRKLQSDYLLDENGNFLTIGDMKRRINLWLAELGAENPEGTIFSIGRDAGIPHNTGNPQDFLRLGIPIVFDIFPREKGGGYFYDFTRTWCLGYATDEVQVLHEQVLKVHHQILQELQPLEPFASYQARACDLFRQMGHATIEDQTNLSQGYVHSIGHGLGLEVHENPFSGVTASETDIFQPGSVFTIEPGLYYPSREIGIRIEDTIFLDSDNRFKVFVEYPYDLILPTRS